MKIRNAHFEDAGAIAKIWNREIREGVSTFNSAEKTETDIRELTGARRLAFLVVEIEGQVVGFATYFQFRGGIGYAHSMEHTIHLSHTARGRGVGRKLMERLTDAARTQKAHSLIAGIGGENETGIAFHRALGFEEVGRLPEVGRKFGRWMDLVFMQKNL